MTERTLDDVRLLNLNELGEDRMVPHSGVTLYVQDGAVNAVGDDGSRTFPVEALEVGGPTIQYDSDLDSLVVVK